MKSLHLTSFSILVLCGGLSYAQSPNVEVNEAKAAMLQAAASRDVPAVLRTLPAVERLWQAAPEVYLSAVKQAVPVLRSSLDPGVREAALATFTNLLDKTCPTNSAVAYFNLKREIILDFLNLDEVANDGPRLLDLARFVGEVRSRMIPIYTNRGTAQPGLKILLQAGVRDASSLTNPVLKKAYEKAVKDNEEDMAMNQLQLALHSANEILTFHLLHCAGRFPSSDPQNAAFHKAAAAAARLTEDEQRQLP